MENISGEKPTPATVTQKTKEKYGGRIVFSTVRTRKTTVCFRGATEKILNDTWCTSKSSNEKTERERIVRTAGLNTFHSMGVSSSLDRPVLSLLQTVSKG
uniref:Uncharacterized protein n=2 Tax=Araneus ventricosus TaxID=182803 RepID=A0A4Y2DYV4_ARAVE|nr:hypothetical protein AVEN_100972-1 [Araneus ventricosus]GBM20988.1 hypothetical protein AVEN_76760-1 [Araneus ventricosus]